MSLFLMVPICLDALMVSGDGLMVLAPLADFSRLAWVNRHPTDKGFREIARPDLPRDMQSDIAYISENIVAQPFSDRNLRLKPGIHLHWALPEALTLAAHPTDKAGATDPSKPLSFPVVPNRWYVMRSGGGQPEKSWIVESDYRWPKEAASGGVTYPLKKPGDDQPPFQCLGRVVDSNGWKEGPPADYLAGGSDGEALTAVGYGEHTFAAFYPNCHSVFGMRDADFAGSQPAAGLRYVVIGWYSQSTHDAIAKLKGKFDTFTPDDILKRLGLPTDTTDAQYRAPAPEDKAQALVNELQDAMHWRLADKEKPADLLKVGGMLCYGCLTFAGSSSSGRSGAVDIAVGNTGTEALSAYLASKIGCANRPDREQVEDQLEALTLTANLQQQQIDLGPKFEEARHEKTYTATSGGTLWTLRPQPADETVPEPPATNAALAADLAGALARLNQAIEASLAEQLDQLNLWQLCADRGLRMITALRRQIFADWYKYMICCYRPADAAQDYPEIDVVKRRIEMNIGWLRLIDVFVGQLQVAVTPTQAVAATPLRPAPDAGDLPAPALAALGVELLSRVPAPAPAVSDFFQAQFPNWREDFLTGRQKTVPVELLTLLGAGIFPPGADLVSTIGVDAETGYKIFAPVADQLAGRINGVASFLQALNVLRATAADTALSPDDKFTRLTAQLKAMQQSQPVLVDVITSVLDAPELQISPDQRAAVAQWVAGSIVDLNLQTAPAPRYWQPTEPVILMAGTGVMPTDRYDADGLRTCHLLEANAEVGGPLADIGKIRDKVAEFYTSDAPPFGLRRTNGDPWHPLFLEWEVEIMPVNGDNQQGNVPPKSRNYSPDFITHNYDLRETKVEFLKIRQSANLVTSTSVFMGRCLITPHSGMLLAQRIDDYFISETLHYLRSKPGQTTSESEKGLLAGDIGDPAHRKAILDYFDSEEHHKAILGWCDQDHQNRSGNPRQAPIATIIGARTQLQQLDWQIQSQALGGFNDAMLMHRQTLQLPIADPLAFAEYRRFTEQTVSGAVADQNQVAPEPLFDFHPLRTGAMKLRRLRLIDSFGRVLPLESPTVITTAQMDDGLPAVMLPPRITQPARVNLRWLSAHNDMMESNAQPLASPVCGWVLPNNLDDSLGIYDGQGVMLGYIDESGCWRSSPGRGGPALPDDIANRHLRRMVKWLCRLAAERAQSPGFISSFIEVLDSALENIDPESFAQHEARALLMGRPLALVRATVNLELQGPPASHQGWEDLHRRLLGQLPDTDGFCDVQFPIRIGEHMQLNDGVAGYWVETGNDYEGDRFYAPQSHFDANENNLVIYQEAGAALNFYQSINDPPRYLSLLVDPRGSIHCTTGVLPTKQLSIPPAHYAQALAAINITFLSAPILTEANHINLPLPDEPGWVWSWVQKDDTQWTEITTTPIVERQAFVDAFNNDGMAIWQQLIDKGWITVLDAQRGKVNLQNQRAPLDEGYKPRQPDIERVFDLATRWLGPVQANARFGPRAEVREGWLQLSRAEK